MVQSVEEATKALWDYIDSLPPEQRARAIEYHQGLQLEASQDNGGMLSVIQKRLKHNSMLMQECINDIQEMLADEYAKAIINKCK